MKELRNSVDYEIGFTDLEEAKAYYLPSEELDADVKNPDSYIGTGAFEDYLKNWEDYKADISDADSLEDLANVLNRYTDEFGNGSSYTVAEL